MIIARQTAWRPSTAQETYFRRAAGVARFTCHGTLEQCDVSPLPCHESH